MPRQQSTYANDLKLGKEAEEYYQKYIKEEFNLELKKLPKNYFADFINEEKKIIIELKRRNINMKRFPTTVIGYDKLEKFREFNAKNGGHYLFLMVFYFNDGIYYFEHKEGYKYVIGPYLRSERIGYVDKVKDHLYLPISKLEPMNNIKKYIESKKIIVRYNI